MHSTYQQFIKDNIHKCPGATPQERMKQCAAMYRQHKAKGGVLSAAGLHSTKPKKSSGGVLSAAGLEDNMEKLKIFKEHMASKPKAIEAKGGLLSGAGMHSGLGY